MNYEISNVVSNHKYSAKELRTKHPFKNGEFFLIEDQPENLFRCYIKGHCLKPHAFTNPKDAAVHTIVLDFDNLTKTQYDCVIGITNSIRCCFGDDSAGMKTHKANFKRKYPDKPFYTCNYKYKVFFPTESGTLCTFDDLNRQFKRAVSIFNPSKTNAEVEHVWEKWCKTNNQSVYFKHDKNGHKAGDLKPVRPKYYIEDPEFSGWILPDVAMLHSFRTQVTYSVNVIQNTEFMDYSNDIDYWPNKIGISFFKTEKSGFTSKDDYSGLEWKTHDDNTKIDLSDPKTQSKKSIIMKNLEKAISIMEDKPNDTRLHYPYSKSVMAVKLQKNHFDDLIMDKYNRFMSWAIFTNARTDKTISTFDFDDEKSSVSMFVKCCVRNACEWVLQGGNGDELPQNMCLDIVSIIRIRYGNTIFKSLKNGAAYKALIEHMAVQMLIAWHGYENWRLMQKMNELPIDKSYEEHLRNYFKSKDNEELSLYCSERSKTLSEHRDEALAMNVPYDYVKRGLKKEILSELLRDWVMEIKDEESFVGYVKMNYQEVPEERLRRWFIDYRREFNKMFGTFGTIHKQHKQHSSKYSVIFENKTKTEIQRIINEMDISRSRKSRLRKEYLNS